MQSNHQTFIADAPQVLPIFDILKGSVDKNPEVGSSFNCRALSRVTGQDWMVPEFEIGLYGSSPVSKNEIERASITFSRNRETTRHRTRYARHYSTPLGDMKILVSDHGKIYVVRDYEMLEPGECIVQWAYHEHHTDKERVLDNAEYAYFMDFEVPNFSFFLLKGLIYGNDILVFGQDLSMSQGSYRELAPRMD